ncbi:MAG: ribbon-helix-helix domain-containing protein [Chloroflexi bacterium]|nr:ribbon-helix-helix domain-containing protein [Chloroflexota bacterium]
MEKTTLYLPDDLQRELRALSRRTGRPQAVLVREALASYLADNEAPWPTSIGSATSDGSVQAKDARRWVHEQWSRDDARPWRRSDPV